LKIDFLLLVTNVFDMKKTSFMSYFLFPLVFNSNRIENILSDKNNLLKSFIVFLFLGMIYTLSVNIAYFKGIHPQVEPFLKIAVEDYYFYQRFYQIPFFILISVLFAGNCRLLNTFFKGNGKFEQIFCITNIALTFPMFLSMWLPETFIFIFYREIQVWPIWIDIIRQIIGIIWPLTVIVYAVSKIEKIKWYYSLITTLIAFLPNILLMIIFIR